MRTPSELRRRAMRILRDVSPDLRAAEELLSKAEAEDERERELRRMHRAELEPELYAGCSCGGADGV